MLKLSLQVPAGPPSRNNDERDAGEDIVSVEKRRNFGSQPGTVFRVRTYLRLAEGIRHP